MKKGNRHIQKEADDLLKGQLRNIFFEKDKRIGENPSTEGEEEGVDFFFEVFNGTNNEHEFFIFNQNKGTDEKIKPIKQKGHNEIGNISFQLDLKHVKYFYFELFESITFTLCDINNKVVYWYHIQNDSTIPKRIEAQVKRGKQSLQIYIPSTNILNTENFNRFIDEINEAKLNQIRKKYGTIIEANTPNYSLIKENTNGKHIIDKLVYTIELFENFKTIPRNIIEQLYPFKKNKESLIYFSGYTLHSDNEEIFDLIENCIINEGKYELKNGIISVEKQSKNLETIFQFFRTNVITHLSWTGKEQRNPRLVLIPKFSNEDVCDCERCNYDRLNFSRTIKILKKPNKNYTIYEKLRSGYAAFQIGEIVKATEIFFEVYNINKDKNPIAHITAKYNLIQLKKINSHQFVDDEKNTEKLNEIDYESDELFISSKAPYFIDIFKSIKDYSFFHNSLRQIDEVLFDINKLAYNDKHGGWISNNKYFDFKTIFVQIYSFLENNLLIFNYYGEYKTLTTKVLEGLFALYTLKNKHAEKYEAFEVFMLDMWIFHVKYEDAQFLLKKYDIDKLYVRDNALIIQKINDYVDNLNLSYATIESNNTTYFIFKIERILKNIVLILSRINIESKELNEIFSKILDFSDKVKKPRFHQFGALSSLLHYQEEVENSNVERLIHLMEKYHYKISNFSYLIRYYVDRSNDKEIEKFVFKLLKTNDFTLDLIRKENSRENYFRDLWYAYPFLNGSFKEKLNQILLEYLNESFDSDLFNWASIYEIIEYDEELFQKLIETIPDESKSDFHYFYPTKNKMLDKAINLSFKLNLSFDKLRKYSKYSISSYHDYYEWIMNLDGFDYSKFDPMWLTGYHSKYYIRAFKKSKVLISKVEESLKENHIEGVAKAYFNKLSNNK